ncbi:hypothetical protein LEA_18252, partial [human gut metagenome]
KRIRQYMTSYLDIITTVTSVMLIRSGTEEKSGKKKRTVAVFKKQKTAVCISACVTVCLDVR